MSVEIREMIAASEKAEREAQEVYRWLNGDRKKPLEPELRARFVDMVRQEFGEEAAAKAMEQVSTQEMPGMMQ